MRPAAAIFGAGQSFYPIHVFIAAQILHVFNSGGRNWTGKPYAAKLRRPAFLWHFGAHVIAADDSFFKRLQSRFMVVARKPWLDAFGHGARGLYSNIHNDGLCQPAIQRSGRPCAALYDSRDKHILNGKAE